MKNTKETFNNPSIEEHVLDPLSKALLKQNVELKEENQSLKNDTVSGLSFGGLTLNQLTHQALYNGEDLMLAKREYDVLLYLCKHVNELVTFEDLGNMLFGFYSEADKGSVIVNVSRLRKKMEFDVHLYNMLENVRGKGYKLIYHK